MNIIPALAVLDALPHNVTIVDAGRRLVYANPSFWKAAGIDPAACPIGSPITDLVRMLCYRGLYGAGDPEAQVAAVQRIDRSQLFRRRVRSADGTLVTEIMSYPLPDGGYATCGVDVTGLAQADAAAQARLRALEGVFGRMRGGLGVFDRDLRLSLANPAYADLLGLPGEPLTGMTHHEILALQLGRGEFAEPGAAREIAAQMEGERARRAIRHRERPSGEVLRFDSQPTPDGGLQVEVDDITALRRAEDEARRRAAVLDGVLGTLPHGVVVYGPDRRVAMFNAAYARIMDGAPVAIGEHVDTILARRLAAGEFSEEHGRLTMSEQFGPVADGSRELQRVRKNGTVLAIRAARLPDGGHISVVTDVTALHAAEAEARRRAAMLEASLAAMRHGISMFGPDHRLLVTNAKTSELTGVPAEELQPGITLAEMLQGQARRGQITPEAAARATALDRSQPLRYLRSRPDGVVLEVISDPMPDGGFVVTFSDVTALQRAEAEARDHAALLDAVLDSLPDGVCVWDGERRVRMFNASYSRIMGKAAARIGESLDELAERRIAAGETSREQAAILKRHHFGQHDGPREPVRRVRPDGTAVTIRVAPMPGGGDISVISDVTPLYRAEAELQARAAMLEAMLGTIRHGITLYGPDRRVLATNAKTSELTGMPVHTLQPGKLMDELLDEQVLRGHMSATAAAQMKALDRSRPQRYGRGTADGRTIEITSDPTPGGGYVLTYADVTDDRRIRAELERARVEAESASRAKSRFLATMSHELRSPLSAMIGFAEAIGAERDPARISEYAGAVRDAGRHLLLLIDDILDVARSQTGALEIADAPVELCVALQSATRAVAPAAAEGALTLVTDLEPGLPALRGDARRLHQVLLNLLSNAVKFTPAGGRVTLSAAIEDAMLAIRVADTGIGIAPEDRDRVFEPFTQVDATLARRFQGSGLGLYLARTLAVALGGTLTLEDQPGPGTLAVLRFPAERLVQPAAAHSLSEGSSP